MGRRENRLLRPRGRPSSAARHGTAPTPVARGSPLPPSPRKTDRKLPRERATRHRPCPPHCPRRLFAVRFSTAASPHSLPPSPRLSPLSWLLAPHPNPPRISSGPTSAPSASGRRSAPSSASPGEPPVSAGNRPVGPPHAFFTFPPTCRARLGEGSGPLLRERGAPLPPGLRAPLVDFGCWACWTAAAPSRAHVFAPLKHHTLCSVPAPLPRRAALLEPRTRTRRRRGRSRVPGGDPGPDRPPGASPLPPPGGRETTLCGGPFNLFFNDSRRQIDVPTLRAGGARGSAGPPPAVSLSARHVTSHLAPTRCLVFKRDGLDTSTWIPVLLL